MLCQFFVLSPRGDTIVTRDFRGGGIRGLAEVFFRRVRKNGHTSTPVIIADDVRFVYLKRNGLYFALTTSELNAPVPYWIELLEAVVRVVKDFCGVLSEDSMRKNFALVYEIVDEMFDFGYIQASKTSELTNVIRNEPAGAAADLALHPYASSISNSLGNLSAAGLSHLTSLATTAGALRAETSRMPKTVPSNASQTPINTHIAATGRGADSADIFIDIVDRVNVEMNAFDGSLRWMTVDGLVVVKSYLADRMTLRLGLNEELVVKNPFHVDDGEKPPPSQFSHQPVVIDDCLFNECVSLKDFNSNRSLIFTPPQGEFTLMRYRVGQSAGLSAPLTCVAQIHVPSRDKVDITVTLRPEGTQKGIAGVAAIQMGLPNMVCGGSTAILGSPIGQQSDIDIAERNVTWTHRKLNLSAGDAGFIAKLSIDPAKAPKTFMQALSLLASGARHEPHSSPFSKSQLLEEKIGKYFGPIAVTFELPMHTCSKLQIRYLRMGNGSSQGVPRRWIRYVTQSASFTVRFS